MQNPLHHKIIFLFTPGPLGGAEKVVLKGLEAMKKAMIPVELWLIKEKRAPQLTENFLGLLDPAVTYRIFETNSPFDFGLIKVLKKEFSGSPLIVHAHGFKSAFYSKLTLPKSSKLIITHHGRTSHTLKVKFYEMIESYMMKRSHAVIAVSSRMKEELKSEGISPEKLFLVENILSLNTSTIKKEKNSKLTMLFVGRLSPEKGCHILIEAMIRIPQKHRPIIKIIGDGQEREKLETEVKLLGLQDNIQFKGFQKDISSFLNECHALIMPSLREGQPMALIEACCSGIPVIASNTGGIPELITHNENGLLFETGSPDDLSLKIVEFTQKLKVLSENAEVMSEILTKRFSEEKWVEKTVDVYQTVLSH